MDNNTGINDAKCFMDVINDDTALATFLSTSTPATVIETVVPKVNGLVAAADQEKAPPKKPPTKKARTKPPPSDVPKPPPKPRAPRKKPTTPPGAPKPPKAPAKSRAAATPKPKTAPAPVTTQVFTMPVPSSMPIYQNAYISGAQIPGLNSMGGIHLQQQQPQTPQQGPGVRGARTLLPKPPGGVQPVIRPIAPANTSGLVAQQMASASIGNNVFPNGPVMNPVNLNGTQMLQAFNFGNGMHFANQPLPPQLPPQQQRFPENNQSEHTATGNQMQPVVNQNPSQQPLNTTGGTMNVILQTIQTSTGPVTIAIMPKQFHQMNQNSFATNFPQPSGPRPPIPAQGQNNNFVPQNNFPALPNGFPGMNMNFLQHTGHQEMQPQQPLPPMNNGQMYSSEPPEKKQKVDDFNMEEFLIGGTFSNIQPVKKEEAVQPVVNHIQNHHQVLDELVSGLFQSQQPSTFVNGILPDNKESQVGNSVPVTTPAPKKPRPKREGASKRAKKGENSTTNKKIEEILKSYAVETAKQPAFPDPPPVVVVPSPPPPRLPTPPPPPPPVVLPPPVPKPVEPPPSPPKPPRKKTDLSVKNDKDLRSLEKVDMTRPFKSKTNAINRLLPFHLLSEPEPSPEVLQRENRAFSLISNDLVQRERDLYSRFMTHVFADAAQPVSELDILTCSRTWLEAEQEEFDSERALVERGFAPDPPAWVYSDLRLDKNVPYFDHDLQASFWEPADIDMITSPPFPEEITSIISPAAQSSATKIIVKRLPEAGKIKLCIKRAAKPDNSVSPVPVSTSEPKKISLKFKLSANTNKWVVGRMANTSSANSSEKPDGSSAPEDVVTQSAVESILQFGKNSDPMADFTASQEDRSGSSVRSSSLLRQPVMGNGSVSSSFSDAYFYGSQGYSETEAEDPALDEAIQSILS